MPINTNEIINVVSTLANERNIQVSVTESLKGGLITGGMTMVGGLLGGPIGMTMGGIIGVLTAASRCNDFKPLAQVLMELPDSQKRILETRVTRIWSDLDVTDARYLMMIMSTQTGLAEMVVMEVLKFVRDELHLSIQS